MVNCLFLTLNELNKNQSYTRPCIWPVGVLGRPSRPRTPPSSHVFPNTAQHTPAGLTSANNRLQHFNRQVKSSLHLHLPDFSAKNSTLHSGARYVLMHQPRGVTDPWASLTSHNFLSQDLPPPLPKTCTSHPPLRTQHVRELRPAGRQSDWVAPFSRHVCLRGCPGGAQLGHGLHTTASLSLLTRRLYSGHLA